MLDGKYWQTHLLHSNSLFCMEADLMYLHLSDCLLLPFSPQRFFIDLSVLSFCASSSHLIPPLSTVFLHLCWLYACPSFGLSRYFSTSLSISPPMCLCLSSDTTSAQINYPKPHLILLHIRTLTHSVMDLLH